MLYFRDFFITDPTFLECITYVLKFRTFILVYNNNFIMFLVHVDFILNEKILFIRSYACIHILYIIVSQKIVQAILTKITDYRLIEPKFSVSPVDKSSFQLFIVLISSRTIMQCLTSWTRHQFKRKSKI